MFALFTSLKCRESKMASEVTEIKVFFRSSHVRLWSRSISVLACLFWTHYEIKASQ
jgi:hypothetical protein